MKRKQITIRDIAKLADVSRQTVSRIINNSNKVAPHTRDHVLKIIRSQNYVPNPLARSLTTGRTSVIGIIVRSFSYVTSQIIEGAIACAHENGFQILIGEHKYSEYGEPITSSLMYKQHIEGLFIVYQGSYKDNFRLFSEHDEDTQVVTIGYESNRKNITKILFANSRAAYRATMHLINLGHKRIVHIRGPKVYYNSEQRLLGYFEALKEAGIPKDKSLIVQADWTVTSGYESMKEFLTRGMDFTAVFSQNDLMAIGCLRALKENGLRVPQNIALVGFDNIQPSEFIEPPLTTIDYPGYVLGALCIKVLIERIKGSSRPPEELYPDDVKMLEPKLIIRESCGASIRRRRVDSN